MASAAVVLVIIGPKWLEILQERKSAAVDHLRAEVRLALEATTSVVPVLIGHARMPTDTDFEDSTLCVVFGGEPINSGHFPSGARG